MSGVAPLMSGATVAMTTPLSENPEPWIIGAIKLKQPPLGVGSHVVGAGKSDYGGLLFVPRDTAASKIAGNEYAQYASNNADMPKSSDYAANATEFMAGILQESNYGLIRDTDHYAKSAAEFKVSVSQEPNYAEINDKDADLK